MISRKQSLFMPICVLPLFLAACGDSVSTTEPQDELVGKWRIETLYEGDDSDTLELYSRNTDDHISLVTKEKCIASDTVKAVDLNTNDIFTIVCGKKTVEILRVHTSKGNKKTSKEDDETSTNTAGSSSSREKNRSSSSYYDDDDYYSSSSRQNSNGSCSSAEHTFTELSDKLLNPDINYGTVTDTRDGQTYKTVQIGIQTWMAQNMNLDTDSSTDQGNGNGRKYNIGEAVGVGRTTSFKCDETNSINPQGVCPFGWHVPSIADWKILERTVNNSIDNYSPAVLLSKSNPELTNGISTPTDDFGFSAIMDSYWTTQGKNLSFNKYGMYTYSTNLSEKNFVRCVKNYNMDSLVTPTLIAESIYDSVAQTLTDLRDNQVYKTAHIGDHVWMAENLNYVTQNGHADNGINSICHSDGCAKYGRYYQWTAAMDLPMDMELIEYKGKVIQGLCPKGWHIPSMEDMDTLVLYVGGKTVAGEMLADTLMKYVDKVSPYGFNLKGGDLYSECSDFGKYPDQKAYLWTTTNYYGAATYFLLDGGYFDKEIYTNSKGKLTYMNVRCLRDERSTPPDFPDFGSFTDKRDGRIYRTVEIGDDTWMADNMKYTDNTDLLTKNTWCYNDSTQNCETFGRLYTWDAATLEGTVQGICPDGWHVSTRDDWENLIAFINDDANIGLKLKSSNYWKDLYFPKNDYGFSALPAGYRDTLYHAKNNSAHFWTSTEVNDNTAFYFDIEIANKVIAKYAKEKTTARSVRCVKN